MWVGRGWRPERRGRFRLICEDWVPQDGCSTRRGRCLATSAPPGLGGAHNAIAGPGWRAPAAARARTGCRIGGSVGQARDLPDKARELAGDGDRDGGALLRATRVDMCPAVMQPQLRAPGRID